MPWYVEMGHLAEGVHAGIRSPGSLQSYRRRHELRERALEMILNPVLVWLALPPAEWSTIVCDGQLQAFEGRAHCKESK